MKQRLIKNQKGASLIELLVYFSILSIVLVMVVDILFRTSEFSLETSEKSKTLEEGRFIASRLTYDVRRADSIAVPTDLGETTSTLELTIGGETHTYSLVGGNLEYQVTTGLGTQTFNVNSNQVLVNLASFQRLGTSGTNHTIKISIELEDVAPQKGGASPETFEFGVGVR